jgi:hypothetical protein
MAETSPGKRPSKGRKPGKSGKPGARAKNPRTFAKPSGHKDKAAGGNRVRMAFSCPTPKANEIDARWHSLKLQGRSEYLAALVAADLAAAREGRSLID